MNVLEVADLHKSFGGVRAVDGLSFTVAAGEILALIGPNGAGKSTSFNLLNGQLAPDRGTVRLLGCDITGLKPRHIARLGVGRSFQIATSFASMTVRENLQTALSAHHRQTWRFWRDAMAQHVPHAEALLSQVGLLHQADRAAGVLAYGDLKRLDLAIALAGAPKLLLMDEPSAGMAAAERGDLMRLVRDLATAHRIAVLFTEHDMAAVFAIADRVMALDRGQIIAIGDPASIRANPAVQASYLGAAP